uniref:NAD(P)-binding domain-containing protein n=1 Tax=Eutreptiella gymnastica TaxID=73025 RepID=A0A7S4CQY0_9EUGL
MEDAPLASLARRASEPVTREYHPRNILLTGGCGFIGSHVVTHLATKYPSYNITVLDKLDYCAAKGHLDEISDRAGFEFIHGDILSADLVSYVLRSKAIDTVMHFAASTHVDNSFNSSVSFTQNNVMGTHVLLECCRMYGGIRRFVHVSTDEVYGGEGLLQDENSMLAPTNPYACSKAACEFLVRGYVTSFGIPVIITRGNNVYGPRQFPDKLIPKSATLLANGQSCFIHGDGSHMRNFLYAEDAARAFDFVLHKGYTGEVYNIGSPNEVTNLQVIKALIKIFGLEAEEDKYMTYVKDRAFNDVRYSIDSSKLHSLGWQPEMPWEEGLRRTVEWYCKAENLARWPNYKSGLVAHPSLDGHAETMFSNANAGQKEAGGKSRP